MRVGNLKNGKAAGKNEITGEILQGGDDMVVDWIWSMCSMVVESGVDSEDWISAVIVTLYKGKGKMIKCKIYRGISLLIILSPSIFRLALSPFFSLTISFVIAFISLFILLFTSAISHKNSLLPFLYTFSISLYLDK